jgi:hypothetical protein
MTSITPAKEEIYASVSKITPSQDVIDSWDFVTPVVRAGFENPDTIAVGLFGVDLTSFYEGCTALGADCDVNLYK